MLNIVINKKQQLYILISNIVLLSFFLFLTTTPQTTTQACSGTCPDLCYSHYLCGCTGSGGCVYRATCYSGEFRCGSDMCCDNCDDSCGSCSCTPPSCPSGYSTNNTGCSTTTTDCTKYYEDSCCGSCGTETRTCWLLKYTLTYTPGSNGSITGTSPQSICRNSSGSAVTAVPNSGYSFVNWSDSSTSNPRTDSNVTADITVTANFSLSNEAPTAPTSLLTEGSSNPTGVGDTTPEFSAIFNDPNTGDTGDYYQIQVNTASDFGGTEMWDSTLTAMTPTAIGSRSPDISYAGTTLTLNGTLYYWRIRFADDSAATGAWSSVANFTMNTTPTAPTSLLVEGLTGPNGIADTTPEFSAIFNDPNTGDTGVYYQIQVNTASDFGGTEMWDSTLTSMTATAIGARSPDISYAGTTLTTNGATYYWRIRFADNNGATSPWSSFGTFLMDGGPLAPTGLLTDGQTNPVRIFSATPSFSAMYMDPNEDDANYYKIEVNTNNTFTGTVMWDSGQQATSIAHGFRSEDITYAGTPLTNENITYYWRIKFWDIEDYEGTWSAVAQFSSLQTSFQIEGLQFGGIKLD